MKTVIFTTLLLVNSFLTFSQEEKILPQKKLRVGFNLGVNYSNILDNEGLITKASISNNVGFRLGVLADYRIADFFFISPKAELSFNKSSVNFNDASIENYDVMPVSLDFMTHFQFKLNKKKLSPYIFVGPNIKVPLNGNQSNTTEFATSNDFAIDFGIGLDKKTTFFSFAPELRYSYGLLNVNRHPSIQSLNFHTVSLVLNFIG
jgi:hypothetical protein